jgi:hypothetical protein
MVQKQIADAPTPIGTFRPDLPRWCGTIIDRSLAKQPADRFQSAEEFRAALSSAVIPQTLGDLPTLSTPPPPGLSLDPDLTMPHGTPTPLRTSVPAPTPGSQPTIPMAAKSSDAVPIASLPTPTNPRGPERTTTVVMGRRHLAALGALVMIVAVGVAVLAFVALRSVSTRQSTPTTTPPVEAPLPAQPPAPVSGPPASPAGSPAAGDKPPTASPTTAMDATTATPPGAIPPVNKSVATVGAVPSASPVKQDTRKPTTPGPVVADPPPGGRGLVETKPTPPVTPTPPAKPPLLPVTFNQVRVLVSEGGRTRERDGAVSLQLGDRSLVVLAGSAGTPLVSVPYSSLSSVFFSRSKEPKWRDASGKEVKRDLGLGWFRGDRNWIILLTSGEPVIMRVEDSAVTTLQTALKERTGLTIQR